MGNMDSVKGVDVHLDGEMGEGQGGTKVMTGDYVSTRVCSAVASMPRREV